MRNFFRMALVLAAMSVFFTGMVYAADSKAGTLTCVGLYSETSDGYVSFRVIGKATWTVMKVGDVIPANGEIRINVDRDWVELTPSDNPKVVYELDGPQSGEIVKAVPDILKGKSRTVGFPKGSAANPDAKFKDKLVVTQYLGRQIYVTKDGDSKDIKYGDVFDISGKVRIIGINNTLTLMNSSDGVTTVIGPLNFNIEQVLKNENLYKYLNVQK